MCVGCISDVFAYFAPVGGANITLNAREINEVWTEAGATLAGSLIASDLVDELVVYLAPMLLGSEGRPLAALQIGRLLDASRWQTTDLRQIGSDIRIMLRPLRSA